MKHLRIVTANPTSWFLLLLVTFMGTAMLIGFACAPSSPPPDFTPATSAPAVPTEVRAHQERLPLLQGEPEG